MTPQDPGTAQTAHPGQTKEALGIGVAPVSRAATRPYWLNAGRASDLPTRAEQIRYRFYETIPGVLAWGTLGCVTLGSWLYPTGVAIFIIAFDLYWLLKTVFLSLHLRSAFRRMRANLATDWEAKLRELNRPWQDTYHLVLLPMYRESYELVAATLRALAHSRYPKERFIVVLTVEERAGAQGQVVARRIAEEFGNAFFKLFTTTHPAGLPDEMAGKGSNLAWAAQEVKNRVIDPLAIPYKDIVVSAFDIDTIAPPEYFLCLTYHYLTAEKPARTSYQPIPIYANNIWEAPSFARVVSFSASFWHMMQQ
ncbi:MAG: hypothetical protein Q8R13_05660, partial [bacterium]|nr:hypothetical protein [bacterium]MDZ4296612.1 hypothetical protein [Patescibacteria group bacterium]